MKNLFHLTLFRLCVILFHVRSSWFLPNSMDLIKGGLEVEEDSLLHNRFARSAEQELPSILVC